MDDSFRPFDWHRIFFGDAPLLFLLEIVFRTLIMYTYTVFLLRLLGKRGMGQLSMLELAIIISFGSAVGDPMVGADIPILHGVTAITVVTIFQITLEFFINKNRKVEAVMEGSPNIVVSEGLIDWDSMKKGNISKEDLFRSLRGKGIQHLGQIKMAFFETSGAVSVFTYAPDQVKPGLPVLPDEMLEKEYIEDDQPVDEDGLYCCVDCGSLQTVNKKRILEKCVRCGSAYHVHADDYSA
jgi:uncharacterized membrane protein YcaP (DUF421 family)